MEEVQQDVSTVDRVLEKAESAGKARRRTVKKKSEKKEGFNMEKEFVKVGENWIPDREGDVVEGYVGEVFVAPTKIGQAQFVMIGDHRVLISGGLKPLLTLQGSYVKVTYQGFGESAKGKFRKFEILRRPEE